MLQLAQQVLGPVGICSAIVVASSLFDPKDNKPKH